MVAIENFFGIIIFIVFILMRMLGQKKPAPPRRTQRPPAQSQEPARVEPRSTRTETKPPVAEGPFQGRKETADDEFFPIPDDLREIFGLPTIEKEKPREVKVEPEPLPAIKPIADQIQATPNISHKYANKRKAAPVVPGLNLSLDKNAVMQGIIWSEVLNTPRSVRGRRIRGR